MHEARINAYNQRMLADTMSLSAAHNLCHAFGDKMRMVRLSAFQLGSWYMLFLSG